MQRLLLKIFALGAGGLILSKVLSEEEENYNEMANTHNQFLKFEQSISLTPGKKTKLIASRVALENRIINYFRVYTNLPLPKFYIQGSYKMRTMILGKDGTYDVDLGIYFLINPNVTAYTVQSYIANAVNGHTPGGVEHREKCIRVKYRGDFDIDLPVYYKGIFDNNPYLATKSTWQKSDPKELCDWFERQRKSKDNSGQLLRLIKYFKVWANNRSRKMPSGIAFTVWVTNNYKQNSRDDIAFYETAKAIKSSLYWGVSCINPATPNDDLTSKLDSMQKRNFLNEFDSLITDADLALRELYLTRALSIWKKQLGDKFPTI